MRIPVLLLLALTLPAPCVLARQDLAKKGLPKSLLLLDTQGRKTTVLPIQKGEALVLFFIGSECPISNSYAPAYSKLYKAWRDKKVRFLAINAVDRDASLVEKHRKAYSIPFAVLMDPGQRAARAFGATVTPHTFLVADGKILYKGRITDRWGSRTAKRNGQVRQDLDRAIRDWSQGKDVAVKETQAFGCAIPDASHSKDASPSSPYTYAEHVLPILQKRCMECHREGEVAPFAMEDYDDVRSWADEIVEFTKKGIMPPWKAVGPKGVFKDDCRLSDREKRILEVWAAGGTPKGDLAKAPSMPTFPSGWKLGKPDLILELPEYEVSAEGDEEYVLFVLPLTEDEQRDIRAIDYQPGNKKVVHHMLGFLDAGHQGRALDAADPKPGYRRFGGPGFRPEHILGGWAPGARVRPLPEGVAFHIGPGRDMVVQMHYYKTGKLEKDRSRIGIYFSKKAPAKYAYTHELAQFRFKIPAGAKNHAVKKRIRLRADVEIHTLFPHMHLLGSRMSLEARLPDGSHKTLIDVRDWDFNWQLIYEPVQPILLPKGTQLTLTGWYDNSAANPRNPHRPPQDMGFGERTVDEMCYFLSTITFPAFPKLEFRKRRR